MERVCFTMLVAPEHIGTYTAMHANAWPELLEALHETGWENYSLFLRDDGFLVGYLESRDWPAASAEMGQRDVSARWSLEMDQLVVPGSRMLHPPLLAARGSATPDASRHCAVLTGHDPRQGNALVADLPWSSVALFRADDGPAILYGESATADWRDELARSATRHEWTVDARPLTEVFNLSRLLAR